MEERKLTICYTSDLHGHFYPTTYADRSEQALGLFRLAPRFQKDGNTLVIDGGDILQGSPFAAYCKAALSSPAAIADIMNRCGYDAITLGNHDFNYGTAYLRDYLRALRADCVCQNLCDEKGETPFPYVIKTMANGLRVGIAGVVTDFVNVWEKPENLSGIRIGSPFEAAKQALEAMAGQADITICVYHGGFERDLGTGRLLSQNGENIAYRLCEELGYDILLTGHQHLSFSGRQIHGTFALQPTGNGREFHKIEVVCKGGAKVINSTRVSADTPADQALREAFSSVEEGVQAWLDEDVGALPKALLPAPRLQMARYGNGIAALFLSVQLHFSGAQITAASLANEVAGFRERVTRRDILASYPYSNTMVVLEVTGEKLKAAIERSASYFALDSDGRIAISEAFLMPKVEHYNYDYYAGVRYCIDVARPVGQRVVSLCVRGNDVRPGDVFSICVSNYRASGSGGYEVYAGCRVLREIQRELSDLITEYFESGLHHDLDERALCDYRVIGGR
ncbi:MAG: bifunctional UDP-sugar hydrolase/5'-nucleotidase [Candidatus Pelethousia sp.]|nr:bifunctional UDP-sugar hydrolase/5'-nucleotidase [Candidatus Pelethousia sp.]